MGKSWLAERLLAAQKLPDRAGPARDMPDGLIIWYSFKPTFFKLFRPDEIAGDFRGTSFACGNLNLLQNHISDCSNDVLAPVWVGVPGSCLVGPSTNPPWIEVRCSGSEMIAGNKEHSHVFLQIQSHLCLALNSNVKNRSFCRNITLRKPRTLTQHYIVLTARFGYVCNTSSLSTVT